MSVTDLRKKAISGSTAENHLANSSFAETPDTSGTTTPTGMTKNDSIVNLTKPSLYGIYNDNDNSSLNLSKEDIDMYATPPSLKHAALGIDGDDEEEDGSEAAASEAPGQFVLASSLTFVGKVAILTATCFLYNQLTQNLHNSHIDLVTSSISYHPLKITNTLLAQFLNKLKPVSTDLNVSEETIHWVNYTIALTLQGLAMGLIVPIMDLVLPPSLSQRLLSLAPKSAHYNPRSRSRSHSSANSAANLTNDIVRSLITFLGLLYAVRKVEWSSPLQLLLLWSLLNPCLWLLLDGTISGFLSSILAAIGACVCVYFQSYDIIILQDNDNFIAIWLLVASFFFCGLIIFGKLGRALFGN